MSFYLQINKKHNIIYEKCPYIKSQATVHQYKDDEKMKLLLISDENGIVSLGIKLRPGDYIVTAEYEGCRVSNNVKVLPTLVTKDLVMKYMDGSSFTAQTLDGQGNPLANQKISFNVNGVFYHRTTDENGMASLHIRLNPGKYIITSIWNEYQIGNNITIA